VVHEAKMIEGNEWSSKLFFYIRFFAFLVNPNERILFMSIDANPSEFVGDITILGIFCPYAYNSIVVPRSKRTHAVVYPEYTALAGVNRMGPTVDKYFHCLICFMSHKPARVDILLSRIRETL
jgi:hypothetical protein